MCETEFIEVKEYGGQFAEQEAKAKSLAMEPKVIVRQWLTESLYHDTVFPASVGHKKVQENHNYEIFYPLLEEEIRSWE